MTPPPHRAPHRAPPKRLSLSPPAWKDQLRQRCMQRLKRDRGQLLARLRRPGARTSVAQELQRLVACERSALSVDDLLLLGRVQERDYLEIVHALEAALQHEAPAAEAEHAVALEDAELEALLAGMDLDAPQPRAADAQDASCVLCPICKVAYLREHAAAVSCVCGFSFRAASLQTFQDAVVAAFQMHRDACPADPTFEKMPARADAADALRIKCAHCGCNHALP